MSGIEAISGLAPLQSVLKQGTVGSIEDKQIGLSSQDSKQVQSGSDFSKFLSDALQKVNDLQKTSDVASAGLVSGEVEDMHTAVIAMEKASLALSLTVEVRNKVLDAYQEMMRMQI